MTIFFWQDRQGGDGGLRTEDRGQFQKTIPDRRDKVATVEGKRVNKEDYATLRGIKKYLENDEIILTSA
jgi:hypothetical protein